ncbi:YncE family protein [Winogradskyella sp. PC D3.3]
MKKYFYKLASLLMLVLITMTSCTSDDRDDPISVQPPSGDYTDGIFILNEGGYGYSNASVSFLDNTGEVYNSIYSEVNGMGLGDTAQSMGFYGENAYLVVNNSATVEVVNRYTFEYIATVSDMIVNPRYIEFSDNKGYITNWGDPNDVNDDYVAVLNLDTNLIEATIPVAEGPEKILLDNGKLYVTHKGGYGYGNTISIIDVASQSVLNTITVADVPDGMVIDNGFLYVMCSGKASWTGDETLAKLFKINLSNTDETTVLDFQEEQHPNHLEFENGLLYYTIDDSVYMIDSNIFQLPESPIFSPEADGVEILYAFKVYEGTIYIADAKDYTSNGEVFIYNRYGDLQNQFSVQIIPNAFYFNNL